MTREEVFEKVREVLVDALAVDEDEVRPEATLNGDLGAESIDFLDIVFKLEQVFGFKVAQGELFPDNVMSDDRYVKNGKVTPEGLETLRQRLPHVDFSALDADADVSKVAEIFTVDALVRFCERKLAAKA
ncbi:MAG: acyl carrier protein [Phycisphaeraceae bacterium]|nr:acyl carrier protein [Phycisphaeraceae bacterium]MCW5755322.1 acyl carrier protein [Phycisphaeraceae bacterium]